MTIDDLNRGNAIKEELTTLNKQWTVYESVLNDLKVNKYSSETLYHCGHSFYVSEEQYREFVRSLAINCEDSIEILTKELEAI